MHKVYINRLRLKSPVFSSMYLKPSIICITGLYSTILVTKGGNLALASDIGYGTAERYINNCTAKFNKTVMSLHFVVNDENIIPKPKPNIPIIIT